MLQYYLPLELIRRMSSDRTPELVTTLNIIKEQGCAAHAGFARGTAPFLMLQGNIEIVYEDLTALFLLTKTIRKCT